jgi:integrase
VQTHNDGHDQVADLGEQTLEAAFEQWVPVRQLGPDTRTLGNYKRAWTALIAHLTAELGREPRVGDLNTQVVNAYLSSEGDRRSWSEQTRRTYGGSIASVVSGMRKAGIVSVETIASFRAPTVTEREPLFFTTAQLARIFDTLEARRSVRNVRLRAVANLMLDCGARPVEIARLRFADLIEESSCIRLLGKGAKERTVPVGARTWRFLDEYLAVRGAPRRQDEPVFVDLRTATRQADELRFAKDFREVLIEAGLVPTPEQAAAGVEDPGYCLYTMRKTFGDRAGEGGMGERERGMDVGEIAAIMGHSPESIPMLEKRYRRPSLVQKQRAHASARPAEGFHDLRERGDLGPTAVTATRSFFARHAGAPRWVGKSPSSQPSSRKRTKGA